MHQGGIKIGFDYKKGQKKIVSAILKCNECTQEAGGEIAMIKRLLERIKFEVSIILVRGHEENIEQHQIQPLKHLLKECDNQARKERENLSTRDRDANMKYCRMCALMREDIALSRSAQETIRIIDTREAERAYGEDKLKHKCDCIDSEARNAFDPKKVAASMIKCTHGYNHCGLRDTLINKNMIEACCPRCQELESWDHAIKCEETISMRKEFIQELLKKLLKYKNEIDVNEIMSFCEDILVYLEEDEQAECETN